MIVGGVYVAHATEALASNTVNQCHPYQPGCKISIWGPYPLSCCNISQFCQQTGTNTAEEHMHIPDHQACKLLIRLKPVLESANQ